MATVGWNNYNRHVKAMNRHDGIVAVILAVVAVVLLLFGLGKLFERFKSDCVVELADGTLVDAKSCLVWSKTSVLSCDNHKKYSLYAVKSWECK
jgi:hypothetical protein